MLAEIWGGLLDLWYNANRLTRWTLLFVFGWGVALIGVSALIGWAAPGSAWGMFVTPLILVIVPVVIGVVLFLQVVDPLLVPILKAYPRTNGAITFLFGVLAVYLFVGLCVSIVPIGSYPRFVPLLIVAILLLITLQFAPGHKFFKVANKICTWVVIGMAMLFVIGAVLPKTAAAVPGWVGQFDEAIAGEKKQELPTVIISRVWKPMYLTGPADWRPYDCDVEVRTHDGRIFTTDQSGVFFKETPDGPVEVTKVHSRRLDFRAKCDKTRMVYSGMADKPPL